MGDQNVGKTSIISRFIHDSFEFTSNVIVMIISQLLVSISSPKLCRFKVKLFDYSCGIQLDNKDLERLSLHTLEMLILVLLSLM
ncbi:MAG: hypothetical protein KDD45_15635 [Bdellovibrionales bacterium]|nr:hypothetical protein [Bdellovibrionales bacterium]